MFHSLTTNQEKRSTSTESTYVKEPIERGTVTAVHFPAIYKTYPASVVAKKLPNGNRFYPQATMPFDFDSESLQLQAEQKPRCFSLDSHSLVGTYSQN